MHNILVPGHLHFEPKASTRASLKRVHQMHLCGHSHDHEDKACTSLHDGTLRIRLLAKICDW